MSCFTRVFACPSLSVSKHIFAPIARVVWTALCACNYKALVKVIRSVPVGKAEGCGLDAYG